MPGDKEFYDNPDALQPVFQEMYKALRPSGRAIISIKHPVVKLIVIHSS
jgi:SAM-dependent methyltransferase